MAIAVVAMIAGIPYAAAAHWPRALHTVLLWNALAGMTRLMKLKTRITLLASLGLAQLLLSGLRLINAPVTGT